MLRYTSSAEIMQLLEIYDYNYLHETTSFIYNTTERRYSLIYKFHCRNSISNSKEHKASTLHKKFHFDSVWLEDHLTTKGPGIQDFCSVIAWNTYYLFFDKTVSSRYIYAPGARKRSRPRVSCPRKQGFLYLEISFGTEGLETTNLELPLLRIKELFVCMYIIYHYIVLLLY